MKKVTQLGIEPKTFCLLCQSSTTELSITQLDDIISHKIAHVPPALSFRYLKDLVFFAKLELSMIIL